MQKSMNKLKHTLLFGKQTSRTRPDPKCAFSRARMKLTTHQVGQFLPGSSCPFLATRASISNDWTVAEMTLHCDSCNSNNYLNRCVTIILIVRFSYGAQHSDPH